MMSKQLNALTDTVSEVWTACSQRGGCRRGRSLDAPFGWVGCLQSSQNPAQCHDAKRDDNMTRIALPETRCASPGVLTMRKLAQVEVVTSTHHSNSDSQTIVNCLCTELLHAVSP